MALFSTSPRESRSIGDQGNPLIPSRTDARGTAGVVVTTDTALTHSTVWACVRLRADIVSTLPITTFRTDGNGRRIEFPNPPVIVNPGGSTLDRHEWLYASQVSLDLRGNAFGRILARDGFGFPKVVELLHPDMVSVNLDRQTGRLVYRVAGAIVAGEDIWHERANSFPGAPLGLSVIEYAARTIGVALAAEKFGADWFGDGAHPSSVLTTDQRVDESQAKTIKNRFMSAMRGNREPLVLGNGVKYEAIQVSPDESQFLETMGYSTQQVCRFFGVPPELVGGESGSSMTYSNVEQRSIDFLTYGIGPTLVRREAALSRMLPAGQSAIFDVNALLRTDLETRYKASAIGIAAKFLDPDEVRHDEGRLPLTAKQKATLALVPLEVTPAGTPKLLPPKTPAPAPAPAT